MIYCGDDILYQAIADYIQHNRYDILIVNKGYFDLYYPFTYSVDSLGHTTSVLTIPSSEDVEAAISSSMTEFTKSNNILENSFKVNMQVSSGTFSIGNCIASELQFSTLEDEYWLRKGTEIQVFYIVNYLSQDYYVAAGAYVVDEISHSKGNHHYICYDYMQKFDDLFLEDSDIYNYMSNNSVYNTQKVKGFFMWLNNKGYPVESSGNLYLMVDSNFYKNNITPVTIGGITYYDNWLSETNIGSWFDYTMNQTGIKYTIRDILSIIGKMYGINFLMDERGFLSHTFMYKYRTGDVYITQNNALSYSLGMGITLKGYRFFNKKNEYVGKTGDGASGYAIITTSNRVKDTSDINQIYGFDSTYIGVYNTGAYSSETIYDISCTILGNALIQAGDKLAINVEGTIKYGYITEITNVAFGSTTITCRVDVKKYDITQTKYTQFSDSQYNEIINMQ